MMASVVRNLNAGSSVGVSLESAEALCLGVLDSVAGHKGELSCKAREKMHSTLRRIVNATRAIALNLDTPNNGL